MSPLAKFLVGLAGVGLLTWLWLQPLGNAAAIADDLEIRSVAALEEGSVSGATVSVSRSPVSRTVILEGELPNDLRAEIRDTVIAVRGVSDAVWAQPTAEEIEVATAEAEAVVEGCRADVEEVIASHTITFRSGSPYINPPSARMLDRLAEAARDCNGIRIEIAGHSSEGGRPGANMEMSAFRATTVRDALVERGVPAEMLTTIGKGSEEPLGEDPTAPANRRIEFTVSAMSAPAPEGDE